MASPPLRIEVYTKDFVKLGSIGAPKYVTVEEADLPNIGTATIGVRERDRMLSHLIEPDSGVRLWIRDADGSHVMSGMVLSGDASSTSGVWDINIRDDSWLFGQVLGWVVPDAPITGQGQGPAGENWELEGPAETVLKTALDVNALDRLGWPLTIEPDLGRGAVIKAKLRFHPLLDRLWPVVDGAGFVESGLVAYIRQDGTNGLVMGVRERATYPRTLSDADGSVAGWAWSFSNSTVTDVVIGGQGQGVFRSLRTKADPARRAAIGIALERFRDARDVELGDDPTLYDRGQETLDGGGFKNGLRLTFAESKTFRYAQTVRLGDIVTIRLSRSGAVITDRLTAATRSWTAERYSITPKTGEIDDSADAILTRAIQGIVRYISGQQRT